MVWRSEFHIITSVLIRGYGSPFLSDGRGIV